MRRAESSDKISAEVVPVASRCRLFFAGYYLGLIMGLIVGPFAAWAVWKVVEA